MRVKKALRFPCKIRCSALDQHGKRCHSRKTAPQEYHGDHEIYGWLHDDKPGWVRVYMCVKHDTRREYVDV